MCKLANIASGEVVSFLDVLRNPVEKEIFKIFLIFDGGSIDILLFEALIFLLLLEVDNLLLFSTLFFLLFLVEVVVDSSILEIFLFLFLRI